MLNFTLYDFFLSLQADNSQEAINIGRCIFYCLFCFCKELSGRIREDACHHPTPSVILSIYSPPPDPCPLTDILPTPHHPQSEKRMLWLLLSIRTYYRKQTKKREENKDIKTFLKSLFRRNVFSFIYLLDFTYIFPCVLDSWGLNCITKFHTESTPPQKKKT